MSYETLMAMTRTEVLDLCEHLVGTRPRTKVLAVQKLVHRQVALEMFDAKRKAMCGRSAA